MGSSLKKSVKKERMRNLIRDYKHPAYSLEIELLNNIRLGKTADAHLSMKKINELERAHLSSNPLRSRKYSLIIWCSIFTRGALSSKVDYESAFALSDVLINTIDKKNTLKELNAFEFLMIDSFIDLIHSESNKQYAYPISKIAKFINMHVNEKITVKDLSKQFQMHPDYLSSKFKKETGFTLSHYIQSVKIEEAKNLLLNSDNTITQIANILNFESGSYFSKVFKTHTSVTPREFRNSPVDTME